MIILFIKNESVVDTTPRDPTIPPLSEPIKKVKIYTGVCFQCLCFWGSSAALTFVAGLLKDGYELISQALALFSSVCGVLHEDVCMCLRLLGRLSYICGDYSDVSV